LSLVGFKKKKEKRGGSGGGCDVRQISRQRARYLHVMDVALELDHEMHELRTGERMEDREEEKDHRSNFSCIYFTSKDQILKIKPLCFSFPTRPAPSFFFVCISPNSAGSLFSK